MDELKLTEVVHSIWCLIRMAVHADKFTHEQVKVECRRHVQEIKELSEE